MIIGILSDAARTLSARPVRTLSQGLGIALGACVFVLALGLGQTIAAQVDQRFDAVKATTVMVGVAPGAETRVRDLDDFVEPDRLQAAQRVAGLEVIGRFGTLPDQRVRVSPLAALPPGEPHTADVVAADPSALSAIEVRVRGQSLSAVDGHAPRRVALVGRALAHELGMAQPGAQLYVGAVSVTVIGVIEDTERLPQVLRSVVISPLIAKEALHGARLEAGAVVRTRPGAAQVVATNLAVMLKPQDPGGLTVSAPLSPERLRRSVSADVHRLSLAGALVVLVAGTFAIGNLMLLSVSQRVPEIGMRRAMGARRIEIVGMVLTESLLVGLAAGVLGSILGVWTMLGVTIWQRWTPVLDLATMWIGVAAGCAGAVLGGLLPAVVAARVQPAAALRH